MYDGVNSSAIFPAILSSALLNIFPLVALNSNGFENVEVGDGLL